MPTIHCYFENKAAAACATSALNIFCSICTVFRYLHRIRDRPVLVLNLRKIQCAILQLLAFLPALLSPKQKWAIVQ